MTEPPHLLVVDDDARLRGLLRRFLAGNGFRVTVAADAAEARARLSALEFDLIVLDVMMPGETGLELTRDPEVARRAPVLLLTAMGEAGDRIAGLEAGADDYLPKPFEPRELLLRARAILRRAAAEPGLAPAGEGDGQVRFGPFRFDLRRGDLFRGSARVRLTEAETALLRAFAERPGTTLSREELLASGAARGAERAVDVQIARLRRKLEPDSRFPSHLRTVRGRGYALEAEP